MVAMPFDEVNKFSDGVTIHFENGKIRSKQDEKAILDDLLELYLLVYFCGVEAANSDIQTNVSMSEKEVLSIIDEPVAGETWRERVHNYFESGGDVYDIRRIAETDATRIYNTAVLDVADRASREETRGKPNAGGETAFESTTSPTGSRVMKRWITMMDDRVRETHDYLEGVAVPYDADFYTFDGDHARAPGLFVLPENNINCRCTIELFRE